MPPVDAFWSLTMYYVPEIPLVDNPIDPDHADVGAVALWLLQLALRGTKRPGAVREPSGRLA